MLAQGVNADDISTTSATVASIVAGIQAAPGYGSLDYTVAANATNDGIELTKNSFGAFDHSSASISSDDAFGTFGSGGVTTEITAGSGITAASGDNLQPKSSNNSSRR